MELIFLERRTLIYKDHAYLDNEFELVIDIVVNQKSNFLVNKENINASIGDVVILKSDDYSYVGIIETLETSEDKRTKVQANDFKELFNASIPVKSYEGDLCLYLESKIKEFFINNSDNLQNLTYLKIEKKATISGTITFEEDNIMTLTDLIELVNKSYGVNLKYRVEFLRGRFKNIVLVIDSVNSGLTIKDNLTSIKDIVISDSNEQLTNKVTFYPKQENATYKDTISYYLLTDGSITQNKNDPKRFNSVSFMSQVYADKDYELLETKALSLMTKSSLDHQITFSVAMDNNVIIPLKNIFLGDFIKFITKSKTYDTVLTQIKFKNDFTVGYLTLGEYRNKLTDKIKILTKKETTNAGQVSISPQPITDIDGGTF